MVQVFTEDGVRRLIAEAVAPLKARIEDLETENARLHSVIARLKKDSSTSSRPPSSDVVKPPKPPRKDGQKRKQGGQPGHEQYLRPDFPPEAVNKVVAYVLDCCPDCGGTFEVPKAARAVREGGSASPAGIEMRLSDLTLILEGIDLASVHRRPRWRRA